MSNYTQLTQEERYQIYILKKADITKPRLLNMVKCRKSTISRELGRNCGPKGYRPKQAHELAMRRRIEKTLPRIDHQVWDLVDTLIDQEWSPG